MRIEIKHSEMLKTIKYISALAVMGLPLCACSDGIFAEDTQDNTLSGDGEKTPLELAVTLQDAYAGPHTRALNGSFERGDKLVAFIEQVKLDGGNYTSVGDGAAQVSKLVNFTINSLGENSSVVTSDNLDVALYWDDFSNTTDYIRGTDRYLRVGYGYCFNGNTPTGTAALDEATSEVGWTVQTDQSTKTPVDKDGLRKSDLLWAGYQTPVQYNHDKVRPDVEDKVKLPVTYTHAMSKVTIELVLDEGYDVFPAGEANAGKARAFVGQETTPILYANQAAEANAIEQTIKSTVIDYSGSAAPAGITMYLSDDETTSKKRVYEAIIAPTVMKAGMKLATVTVDGNKYDLVLRDELLKTPYKSGDASWASQLYGYTSGDGKVSKNETTSQESEAHPDGITVSGYNYRLVATLKKQRIEVEAKITDWTNVTASIEGTIMFDANVVTSVVDSELKDATGSFDLWRSLTNADDASYDENAVSTDNNKVDKASTYTLTGDKWVGAPTLYWLNGNTPYYFRALAEFDPTAESLYHMKSVDGNTAAAQEKDLLWAQTSQHTPLDANGNPLPHPTDSDPEAHKEYGAGEAIDPRTGNVPLTFKHAMSKISITLQNDENMPEADKLNLEDARISIINLYNGGTISINNGEITNMTVTPASEPMTIKEKTMAQMQDYIVIPQSLTSFENGDPRNLTPIFYSAVELTGIYADGSSLGTGAPLKYYLTSDLAPTGAVYYSNSSEDLEIINSHNAELHGSISTSTIKEPEQAEVGYTYATFNEDKKFKEITEDQYDDDDFPEAAKIKESEVAEEVYKSITEFIAFIDSDDKYNALPESFRLKEAAKEAVKYTQQEIEEAKAIVEAEGYVRGTKPEAETIAEKTTDDIKTPATVATYYNYDEFKLPGNHDHFSTALSSLDNQYKVKVKHKDAVLYTYEEFIALETITLDQYNALVADSSPLPDEFKIQVPYKAAVNYTEDEVNEHNATLTGAIHVGDVKVAAHYVLPNGKTPADTNLTSHAPGEMKTVGNKIMLYVTFPDGTRYSAELSNCLDDTTKIPVTEWESGEHYHYTITLGKETIKFRALVKPWEVRNTTGNATLDWD